MFGKKETRLSFAAGVTTLIAKNTEVVGDIRFAGNVMVEGVIKGNVYATDGADAQARVLGKGVIEGDVYVPTLVINGTVSGNVYASKHIELAEKAVVNGNVHYASIEMVKGAQVNGSLVYQAQVSDVKGKKAAKRSSDGAVAIMDLPVNHES